MRRLLPLVLLFALAPAAFASSTPVGPLPPGPLPHGVHGRVWRIKGSVNGKILREVAERDRGSKVEITFRAVGRGVTVVRMGLTQGETRRAYLGKRWAVHVR
jgi:hypothetical protein